MNSLPDEKEAATWKNELQKRHKWLSLKKNRPKHSTRANWSGWNLFSTTNNFYVLINVLNNEFIMILAELVDLKIKDKYIKNKYQR